MAQSPSGSFGTEQQTVAEYAVNFCAPPFAPARIAVTTVRSCYGAAGHPTPTDWDQWVDFRMLRRAIQRQLCPKRPFASVMATTGTGQWSAVHPALGDGRLNAHKRHSRIESGRCRTGSRADEREQQKMTRPCRSGLIGSTTAVSARADEMATLRQLSLSTRDCLIRYLESGPRVQSRIVN